MIALILALVVAGHSPGNGSSISLIDDKQSADGGPSISLVEAKRVMAAAQADAVRRKVPATIVIVDGYGELVLAEAAAEADGAAFGVALLKARSTVHYRPGTLMFNERSANEIEASVTSPSATQMGGGALLMSSGKIIGAIGDFGAAADAVAKAGAAVLK